MNALRSYETLRNVAEAHVYKGGHFAAKLRRTQGGIKFTYIGDYLAAGGPPVATTLPLTDQPVQTTAGAVPPFFAGLLPEGRRLSSLRRAVKTSADDELSLLLAVGSDTVGNVQIVPAGRQPGQADPLVQVTNDWSEVRFADILRDSDVIDPVALPGVQDKASARMISVPINRAGERYLLKIDPPEFPHVVENESFFLARAKQARLDCATANIVHDADGRAGLLVHRFDRAPQSDGTTAALACEDACQVLGRWPADKYNITTEAAVVGLADCCDARLVALRALYQQICFAWLTGNGDVHAKNLSILASVENEWQAAPAYDLPSTVLYGDKTMALSLQGRTRGISRRHLLDFATAVGLPRQSAVTTLDSLLARLADLEGALTAGAIPFSRNVIKNLVKELRYRRRLASP